MVLQALVAALIAADISAPVAILLVAGELTPDRTLTSLSRDSRMVKETFT
jgi:hypothetical protein